MFVRVRVILRIGSPGMSEARLLRVDGIPLVRDSIVRWRHLPRPAVHAVSRASFVVMFAVGSVLSSKKGVFRKRIHVENRDEDDNVEPFFPPPSDKRDGKFRDFWSGISRAPVDFEVTGGLGRRDFPNLLLEFRRRPF